MIHETSTTRLSSYGEHGSSLADRIGVALVGRSIQRSLRKQTGLVALDLGCGYHAVHLRAIHSKLARGVGVDVSIAEECRSIPRLEYICAPIESTLPSLPPDQFNLVLFISVLEHLEQPLEMLAHCRRVLQPDGLLIVNVPTWWAKPVLELSAFKFGTSPACEMDEHKMYYSKRDLWPLLVQAGFKPSRIKLSYQKLGLGLFGLVRK